MFFFKRFDFDTTTGVLSLHYACQGHHFTEKWRFPLPFSGDITSPALQRVFYLIHLACGVSYFKAFLPDTIVIETGDLSPTERDFFRDFYLHGLGEMSYRNQVPLKEKICNCFNLLKTQDKEILHTLSLPEKALVPIGGGKDSCVSLQVLHQADIPATPFCICGVKGPARPIADCMQVFGVPPLMTERTIAPELIALNQAGQVYNGHVPITGIISFITWACCLLYGYRDIVFSCEKSASSGNIFWDGREINHQYSKSFAFEQAFRHLIAQTTGTVNYFSLLRPLSEVAVAKLFAHLCPPYFDVFTSCNKAFFIDESKRLNHWCCDCDKCRFVFLVLACFLPKDRLCQIFGKNMLDDETQMTGYQQLLGLTGHKPFECVGEIDECRYLWAKLESLPAWENDKVIRSLRGKVPPVTDFCKINQTGHNVPAKLWDILEKDLTCA